jgi:hypothetical protein
MPTPPTPPTPPKMGMKMGSRPGFTPPKPAADVHVETEKFDPATLAKPPRPRPMSEADVMANAEPINIKQPLPGAMAAAEAAKKKKEAEAEPTMLPPEPLVEPLDRLVPDTLIAKLEARFGIRPEEFHETTLEAMGHKLIVTFRAPSYDDYIWSMAVIERKLRSQEDASLLQTEAQRNNMMVHLVNCRVVVKLDGEWLWQVFDREAEIRSVVPNWDGKTWATVPDFVRGTMATTLYELFRKRLHADLLFDLEKAVKEVETARAIGQGKTEEGATAEGDENEDPSSAA